MKKKMKNGHRILQHVYANPRYRGKHLIIAGGEIFVARSAAEAPQLLNRVMRSYPHATPTLVYVPKADALVLWHLA